MSDTTFSDLSAELVAGQLRARDKRIDGMKKHIGELSKHHAEAEQKLINRRSRITGLESENKRLRDLLHRLMGEFDEPDEYMTVFQEAKAALEVD